MRSFLKAVFVLGLAQVSAFGGIIRFSPETAWITPGIGDSLFVKFDVFVESLVGVDDAFTSIEILFGSNDLNLVSFEFDTLIAAAFAFSDVTVDPGFGVYAQEIKVGGFAPTPVSVVGPILLGSLMVDLTGLALAAHYDFVVDGDNDGDRSAVVNGANRDVLLGLGSVAIPEPATISLLGIASLALIRRRRMA